ncbi:phytanoyl-CoA dioxygenase family protein [Flavobacteriales bacterium]|nr:phytanoyl-CoA dioxygenase family protein [Flavobacteriales bacterium]
MKLFHGPVERLQSLQGEQLRGPKLDLEILQEAGCFVVQNALSMVRIEELLSRYNKLSQSQKPADAQHPTEIRLETLQSMGGFTEDDKIQDIAKKLFNEETGWDFLRIVRKDAEHREPVFLHQDFCYQMGSGNSYSLFIALTPNHPDNGGICVHLGTHQLGYLGDAGELNSNVLPEGLPTLQANLSPGDALIMHSAAWHESGRNNEGSDRVYLELHLVSSESPYSKGNICGFKQSSWSFNGTLINRDMNRLFTNSRSQRLQDLYSQLQDKDNPEQS